MRRIYFLLLFFIFIVKLCAQENEPSFLLEGYTRYIPLTKIKSEEAKIGFLEIYNQYSKEAKIRGKLPIKIGIENRHINIEKNDFKNVDLPNRLVSLGLDIETTLPTIFEDIYLRLGINPSFSKDDYDFNTSCFRSPSRIFFINLFNEKLTLIYGLALYPDFDREILPILGLIYKPNSQIIVELIPKRPNISYILNDKASIFIEAAMNNYEFEVSRYKQKNVVLTYKQMLVAIGAKVKLKNVENFLSVGNSFNRRFKYLDNQGKFKVKNSWYLEYRLKLNF